MEKKNAKISLYEISSEVKALHELLVMDDGELTEEIEKLSEEIFSQLSTKVDSIVYVVNSLEDEIEAADKAIKRFQTFKSARKNAIERIKNFCETSMENMEQKKITGEFTSISVSKPRQVVDVHDVDSLPIGYFETEIKPKKKEIGQALKDGEKVDGARLVEGKKSVRLSIKSVK